MPENSETVEGGEERGEPPSRDAAIATSRLQALGGNFHDRLTTTRMTLRRLGDDDVLRFSAASNALLNYPQLQRLKHAELVRDTLTTEIDVYPQEIWTGSRLMEVAATESRTPDAQLIVCSIDGLVDEPTWQRPLNGRPDGDQVVNIDHHQGGGPDVPSSCVQLLLFLRDLYTRKVANGDVRPVRLKLLCNDPDQDVSASFGSARNFAKILALPEAELQNFTAYISVQDLLDRYAAMVPIDPQSPHLRWNAFINEPYAEARRESTFNVPQIPSEHDRAWSAHAMRTIIESVESRLGWFLGGDRTMREVSTDVHPLHEDEDWCLIDEADRRNGDLPGVGAMLLGKQLLMKVRTHGTRFIYSFNLADRAFLPAGSDALALSLPDLFHHLQALDRTASFGGSQRCGGCRSGSVLPPDTMAEVMRDYLES